MDSSYYCVKCGTEHTLSANEGATHLAHSLDREGFERALDFAASAGAYGYITDNTQQYVRDIRVFELLGDKFSRAGMFASREAAQTWLSERMAVNADNVHQILRRLQGDGAGEVDALRHINGSLRGLFHRAEFIRDASGHIHSNTAGIDLQVVNRFTGELVETIQVKSNWSTNSAVLRQTIRDFVRSPSYGPEVTLAGPRELINQARDMGIENRLLVLNDVESNRASGERLRELIERGDAAVEGVLTWQGVAERVGHGAMIGAAVSVGVSAVTSFMAYRQGRISGEEAFRRIAIDGARGATVGAAMGGLSLTFPPGAVGIGIGIVVGSQVRRIVDIAYGKGAYEDILSSLGAIGASLKHTADGVAVVERTTRFIRAAQVETTGELGALAASASETDAMLDRLDLFRGGKK